MTKEELEHILRAAGAILDSAAIVVIGSQAILGAFNYRELPEAATRSLEADILPLDDPEETKADLIDGTIGEGSMFHQTFGIYAQGVGARTSRLPQGWRERLMPWSQSETGTLAGWLLDPYDLLISKYFANREKDREFCRGLAQTGKLGQAVLLERLNITTLNPEERDRIRSAIARDFSGQ